METEPITKHEHKNPGVTADVIINFKGLGVILVKRARNPYKDCWAIPGGFLETGKETIKQTGVRELREETSLEINLEGLDYLGFYDDPNRDPRGHNISHAFYGDIFEGEPQAADDAKEVRIFPLNELPPLAFDHSKIMADYRARIERQQICMKGETS